jgi:hypothetical protein
MKKRRIFESIGTISQELDLSQLCDFYMKVARNARERQKQERDRQWRNSPVNDTKLRQIFCQGNPKIHDSEFQYVLVIDQISQNNYSDFNWISKMKWALVIDLDPSEDENCLVQQLTKDLENEQFYWSRRVYSTDDLQDILATNDSSKVLETIEYGKRTI